MFGRNPALLKLPDKLAPTGFAPMVLFPVVDVTVLFVVSRPTPWAVLSYDHDSRIDLRGSRVLENLSLGSPESITWSTPSSTGKPDEIETTPVRFGEGVPEKCRATATRRHPTLLHVRFDERDRETETRSIPQTPATERASQQVMIAPTSTAPDLDSTHYE